MFLCMLILSLKNSIGLSSARSHILLVELKTRKTTSSYLSWIISLSKIAKEFRYYSVPPSLLRFIDIDRKLKNVSVSLGQMLNTNVYIKFKIYFILNPTRSDPSYLCDRSNYLCIEVTVQCVFYCVSIPERTA